MDKTRRTRGSRWSAGLVLPRLLAAMLLTLCAVAGPQPATAIAQDTRVVLLGFGERYGATLRQHLGCDVAAVTGEKVLAPVEGTVSFVGWVPRDEGVRVRAVTVRGTDGSLVSVSPLAESSVSLGEEIHVGNPLGLIAETGDPSASVPHVHLSLRVNDRYVNPAHLVGLLFSPRVPDAKSESPQPQPSKIPAAISPEAAVSARATAQSVVSEFSLETAPQLTVSAVAAGQASAMSQPAGTVVKVPSLQVVRASRLDQEGSTQLGTGQTAKASVYSADTISGSDAAGGSLGRTLVAWAIFGIGTALGLGALLIGHFCQTAKLAGWLTGLFAVRGNR